MTDRREFARQHAEAFNARTLEEIGKVLATHSSLIVEFACEMQERVDAAEALLAEIAAGKVLRTSEAGHFKTLKLRTDLMNRVDALVDESKRRSQ